MDSLIAYISIAVILVIAELVYFRIADKFNIIDKPNERSSHTRIVLRGGGIIFTIALWIWSAWYGFNYPWLLAGVTLAAGISFVDDIHSLPDSLRLVAHFAAMFLVFQEIGILQWDMWWIIPLALIVAVAGTNIFNFMDGINGITGGYSFAVLIPLLVKNEELKVKSGAGFIDETMLIVILLSVLVFCFFNFRQKAKCFAGDVGSIGMALILVFCIGRLMYVTGDISWIVLYLLYGLDGMLTICHRIMLHENLGEAHRKHAYQLMANELKMPHVVVSTIYMVLQLAFSLVAIYVIPDTILAHWIYLIVSGSLVTLGYILFMMKYYHLHEEYLFKLRVKNHGDTIDQ
jgi:UDP-N-acetylmuramyl pentapeptide phosphotransferase/UDP-N-acetylglucosamine-1-phosphate transferase